MPLSDTHWMQLAFEQAQLAANQDEVPVGAVLVKDNQLIASGHNQPIQQHDPSAHAEMVVLRAGGTVLQNYRLLGTTLYVTLEPCLMCMGAIVHARIARLVYGATDPKAGAVESVFELGLGTRLNHQVRCEGGVMAGNCSDLLRDFFRNRR